MKAVTVAATTALLLLAHGVGESAPTPAGPQEARVDGTEIAFVHSRLLEVDSPTSLQFGPDDRLYVATVDGMIRAYRIGREGPGRYVVLETEEIALLQEIPNHDADGQPRPELNTRMVTGIVVAGTRERPIVYATSSDPRVGDKGQTDLNIDPNSGAVSVLRLRAEGWVREELVLGLPRSAEDHAPHGLQLVGRTLYVAQGGNTNEGAPSKSFLFRREVEFSAAILAIDLDALGDAPLDLRAGSPSDGALALFASGFRNPYDLVWTSDGHLYATDNGPNQTWGGPPTDCSDAVHEGGTNLPDALHLVTKGTYAGHPNPARGQRNPAECDLLPMERRPSVQAVLASSTNGLAEYTASTFGGAMTGDLLTVSFDGGLRRFRRDPSGRVVGEGQVITASMGAWPLDVTTRADDEPFPGTIWVAVYLTGRIQVLEPLGSP